MTTTTTGGEPATAVAVDRTALDALAAPTDNGVEASDELDDELDDDGGVL